MDKYEKLRKLAKEVEATLPWHNHEGDWVTRDHQDIEGLGERDQPADEYGIAACNAVPGLLDENERLREALESLISKLDEIDQHPSFKSLFVLAFTHGAEYDGPSWSDAYAKAREALERKW